MFGSRSLQQYIFGSTKMLQFDLQKHGLRSLNSALQEQKKESQNLLQS